jgi:hypothetical protein
MRTLSRPLVCSVLASLLAATPSLAFNAPLSDEAVREAYFLGQRHDGSFARLLDKYSKRLPPPKSGAYIAFVTFLTPFAQIVRFSENYSGNYSAQQAEADHRAEEEIIDLSVEIRLTPTYGTSLPESTDSRFNSSQNYRLHSYDFWRDFRVRVFEGKEDRASKRFFVEPNYLCSDSGCYLSGATLHSEFPADTFTSDSVTVEVLPPEGPEVQVAFDLTSLR